MQQPNIQDDDGIVCHDGSLDLTTKRRQTPPKSPDLLPLPEDSEDEDISFSPHGSHSSETVYFSSSEEGRDPQAAIERSKKEQLRHMHRIECCGNAAVLRMKCSEAFRLVEECFGIAESTARYEDTFYPLVVEFVRSARDHSSPVPFNDRLAGFRLKDRLSFFLKKPANEVSWMPGAGIGTKRSLRRARGRGGGSETEIEIELAGGRRRAKSSKCP